VLLQLQNARCNDKDVYFRIHIGLFPNKFLYTVPEFLYIVIVINPCSTVCTVELGYDVTKG